MAKKTTPAGDSGGQRSDEFGGGSSTTDSNTKGEMLQLVVAKLERGDAPDRRFPDRRGEYWALCPFHPDRHATNFSVSEKGYHCFACDASGGLASLAKHLGVPVAGLHEFAGDKHPPPPLTLDEYTRVKDLPVDFLQTLGLKNVKLAQGPAVRMPYYDQDGKEVATRYRISLNAKGDRFRWKRGAKAVPYGLWKLNEVKESGYVVLVEGESDAQTLWFHDIPALGIPGSSTWKSEWVQYVDGLAVYVWKEPDQGGEQFVERVGRTLPDIAILTPPAGRKDISECHMLGDDVAAVIKELIAAATPYSVILEQQHSKAVEDAAKAAGELLAEPDILAKLGELYVKRGLVGEGRNAKILYLAITSRFLERPVSIVIKGPSSGGKSHILILVLTVFPAAAYYMLTGMSEKVLAYGDEPLKHRVLVIQEASGVNGDFATYLMRSLLSEGRIRYETVEKTQDGLRVRLIEREGPTGLLITTTLPKLHPENETRMLSLIVRDDRKQTKGVVLSLGARAAGETQEEPDLRPWHAYQRWLELAGVHEVVIPYARELAELSNPCGVRLRRDFEAALNLVRAHAILHQKHREVRDGRVVATIEDYRAVHALVADLVDQGLQASVSKTVRQTVEAVKVLSCQVPTKVVDVAGRLNLDKSAAWRRVQTAIQEGYVVNLEDRKGQPAMLVLGDPLPAETHVLPDPHQLEEAWGGGIHPSENRATLQPHNQAWPPDDYSGPALWRNQSFDQFVTVVAYAGQGSDGRRHFCIEGSATSLPADELAPRPDRLETEEGLWEGEL